jgi:hypothetical protein
MYTPSFLAQFSSLQITIAVIIAMLIFYWLGRIFFIRLMWVSSEFRDKTSSMVVGSLLGLLALLLSFTFGLSNSRYDKRMSIVVDEANTIGTAILRADLYPDSIRTLLRAEFKNYVETRIAFHESGRDLKKVYTALDSANASQKRLWKIVSTAAQDKENLVRTNSMVPALNQMIDIVSSRNALLIAKVPDLIIFLLFILCITASFLIGYSSPRKPEWGIVTCFLVMVGLTIYMILDLDRPRTGIINIKDMYYFIYSLRSMFDNP